MANTRKAFVTPTGGEAVEVEIPADHPDPEAVAVIAYRKKANAWHDDRKLTVRFEDAAPPAPAPEPPKAEAPRRKRG